MYVELFETIYPINTPKKQNGLAVTGVDPGGLGSAAGIQAGDRIIRINGRELRDFLDFQFYTGSEDQVCIEVVKKSGDKLKLEVEVGEGEIWGLDLEHFAPRQCANDCIFCFCNQNPKGSRDSLFFKDEDTRLSFLHGNYTTMSSISKMELDRIVEQRLSPQYVSVHATDPEVRRRLLGRNRPDDVLTKMRYLAQHGIGLHAQIVLCPTINDRAVLQKTVQDLAELYPSLSSIAIVPVVVTDLHNYRHLLTPVTGDYSRELILTVKPWQSEYRRRFGSSFVFLADEFYLRAGMSVPGTAHYGDYPQIEDGVGMIRRFINDARRTLSKELASIYRIGRGKLNGTVATGQLFYPFLSEIVSRLNSMLGSSLKPVAIENRFFGKEVTVAGLIAGSDLLAARDKLDGRFLIVPEQACLKNCDTFLDDMTISDLENRLGIPVAHGGPSIKSMLDSAYTLSN